VQTGEKRFTARMRRLVSAEPMTKQGFTQVLVSLKLAVANRGGPIRSGDGARSIEVCGADKAKRRLNGGLGFFFLTLIFFFLFSVSAERREIVIDATCCERVHR
jgi:hypothetical protein